VRVKERVIGLLLQRDARERRMERRLCATVTIAICRLCSHARAIASEPMHTRDKEK
jgi:hypothetical protein